jgi:pimeloyl-ACP methyl ester carboxylesterase
MGLHFALRWRAGLAAMLVFTALGALAADEKGCALLLLHDKWSSPQAVEALARKLKPACHARTLEMPWSQRRGYDSDYKAALREIAAQVKELRRQGVARVLIGGHGLGANAAIAYAAEIGDVDGVIALAPGHQPRQMYERGLNKPALDEARKLVAAGNVKQMLAIEDSDQGKQRTMQMPAGVMLSYFDPNGLGDLPLTVARVRQHIPLLWVVGTKDPLYEAGEAYAFAKAAPHPLSRYVVVQADHNGTPDAAVKLVGEWIKTIE